VAGVITGIGTNYTDYSIRGYNVSDIGYFVGSATPNQAELVFYGTNPDQTFNYGQTGTYDYGYQGTAVGRVTSYPGVYASGDLRVDLYAVSDVSYLISRSNVFTGAVLFSEPYPYTGSFGPILGRVEGLDPGEFSNYEVQVFSKTDQDYYQSTGVIQANGTWAAPQAFTGTKIAKLIRIADGGIYGHTYAPFVGGFVGEVDAGIKRADLVVYGTNTLGQSGAEVGGFSIPFGTPGYKNVQLWKVPEENLIAEYYWGQGLLRSYGIPQEDVAFPFLYKRTYTYDQAVGIVAATGIGDWDTAERWSRGLISAWNPLDRQWAFSVNSVSGHAPDPYYRNGANFWCASALCFYLNKAPSVPPDLQSAAETVLAEFAGTMVDEYWVNEPGSKQHHTFRGGRGRYQLPLWEFNPAYPVGWTSTEHNTDAYWWAKEYYELTGDTTWRDYGTNIGQVLNTTYWQGTYGPPRAYQGMTNASSPDTAHALDVASWYCTVQHDSGTIPITTVLGIVPEYRTNAVFASGTFTGSFAPIGEFSGTYVGTQSGACTGYTPYSPDYGYPSARGGLWIEGTAGVIHAFVGAGMRDQAVALHNQLEPLLGPNGFPYTLFDDPSYDLRDWTSVAATGWMVIAARPRGWWGIDTLT
jgi:hypothetical protein